ncbi:uncharacterized protein MELLADRAFT_111138 [Melampsora larici-populina 98AG31]|uniref:Uncharacterized protein n=1 Tax=Melampsora larici-populina (strain 98AG31 / pathotype 3-4-7) TaxID=747676 RepID=F4S255_MELLP|nr:uncharacterized protein MELLADRAFT_111138 [Melampsora larici-populina 98AG31]EGG01301.1 hypothetical protein MELLADRAFT_111138 [Melampsora larici-populina 98AG31]
MLNLESVAEWDNLDTDEQVGLSLYPTLGNTLEGTVDPNCRQQSPMRLFAVHDQKDFVDCGCVDKRCELLGPAASRPLRQGNLSSFGGEGLLQRDQNRRHCAMHSAFSAMWQKTDWMNIQTETLPGEVSTMCTNNSERAVRDFQYDEFNAVRRIFKKFEDVRTLVEEVDQLEEDGSNWFAWLHTCSIAIEYITGCQDYLSGMRPIIRTACALVIDRCALNMIRRTIHKNLEHVVQDCLRCHVAKYRLRQHFDPSRSGRVFR